MNQLRERQPIASLGAAAPVPRSLRYATKLPTGQQHHKGPPVRHSAAGFACESRRHRKMNGRFIAGSRSFLRAPCHCATSRQHVGLPVSSYSGINYSVSSRSAGLGSFHANVPEGSAEFQQYAIACAFGQRNIDIQPPSRHSRRDGATAPPPCAPGALLRPDCALM